MSKFLSCVLVFTFASGSLSAFETRRIDMNFPGQMVSAVEELKKKMDADPLLKNGKLHLGKFSGPNLPHSNFELAFETKFEDLMQDRLDEGSDFIVSGEYDFLPGTHENEGLKVIQFEIKVVDTARRRLAVVRREINNTEDIAEIHGATVAPPDTIDVELRNKAVEAATKDGKRSFEIRDRSRITATGNRDYAVEILRRPGGIGTPEPVKPENKNGFAFVDLNVGDTFEIALYSYASKCDAVCVVSIDGLDVANTFCTDGRKYDGYIVKRAKGSKPNKHTIPGWLKTTTQKNGNVYKFVVNELGKGAAAAKKVRNRSAIINVKFFEAVPLDEALPSRNFGEVGRGKPMDVSYTVSQMKLREAPISNVAFRYSTR